MKLMLRCRTLDSTIKWLTCSAIALVLAACASGPRVQSNHDRSVDFSQYETFGFAAELIHNAVEEIFRRYPLARDR